MRWRPGRGSCSGAGKVACSLAPRLGVALTTTAAVLVVMSTVIAAAELTESHQTLPTAWVVVLYAAACLGAFVAVIATTVLGRARAGLVAALLTLLPVAVLVLGTSPVIDVLSFLDSSAEALVHGHDPYSITVHSPYSPEVTGLLMAPSFHDGQTLLAGMPYPPVVAVATTLGWLLGDVRLAGIAAVAGGGMLVHRWRPGAPVAFLVLAPGMILLALNGWTELISVALLVATVGGFSRGSRTAPVWLGLLLVSKQYFVVALPLVLLLLLRDGRWTRRSTRDGGVAVLAMVLGTVPALLWNPRAFWRSLVELPLAQPIRPESRGLAMWLYGHIGGPVTLYSALALAGGLALACLLAWKAPRNPASFAVSLALTQTVVITLSKQAFVNYWFFVEAAVMLGWMAWPGVPDRASETVAAEEDGAVAVAETA